MLFSRAVSLLVPRSYIDCVLYICNKSGSICLADALESHRVQIYGTHQDANPKFHLHGPVGKDVMHRSGFCLSPKPFKCVYSFRLFSFPCFHMSLSQIFC